MADNCQNCELPLRSEQAFCPRCGTSNPSAVCHEKQAADSARPIKAEGLDMPPAATAAPAEVPSAKDFYERGVALLTGQGGSSDHPQAIAAFMNAADLGDAKAMYCAGMMYLNGLGVVASRATAIGFLDKAAAAQLEIASDLLGELNRGGNGSEYPILPIARPKPSPAIVSSKISGVTPGKVLLAILAVVAILGLLGGGWYYVASSRQKAEEERQAIEMQKQAAAEVQRQHEIEQQEKEQALAEEKRRLEEQESQLKQRAEQLEKQEGAVAHSQESAAQAVRPNLLPASLGMALEQAIGPLNRMHAAIVNSDTAALSSAVSEIRALPPQVRGERRPARALNDQALSALRAGDHELAVRTFSAAMEKDSSDQEIISNLGYALMQANRYADAHRVLLGALTINPERSSSWFNLGLTQVRLGKPDAAYASLLLAYKFSDNQTKTREWLQKFAQDDSDRATAGVMTRVLSSIK